jgi:cobalt/nickel transport system permease protein
MPGRAGVNRELYALELLAGKNTALHRLHPGVKVISCVLFMAAVISFDRYSPGRLCPFLFYPCILIALGELPPSLLVKRTALALPFWALILRTLLCVAAVLILIATTPWTALAAQLRRFHVPAIFVTLLELCYRYIGVLIAESESMYTAYKLRSANIKGVALSHIGSFVGHLFLRSVFRAERVYAAMKCRGCSMKTPPVSAFPLRGADAFFLLIVTAFCAFFRFVDLPLLAGRWIGGIL